MTTTSTGDVHRTSALALLADADEKTDKTDRLLLVGEALVHAVLQVAAGIERVEAHLVTRS